MTTTEPSKTGPTFASLDPRDGTVLAEYPVAGPEEVALAVERARAAARWWANQGPRGRREWLLEYKRAISSRAEELASLISAETGKPDEDATLEVMLTVSHLEWAAKNADKVLRRRSVSAGLLMSNQAAYVEYQPYGVVGAIGPWNYPAFTPMGTLSYAMAAGNAIAQEHEVSKQDLAFEFMLNALRLKDGFLVRDFCTRTGQPVTAITQGLKAAEAKGLLKTNLVHIQPTERGFDFLSDLQELFLPG